MKVTGKAAQAAVFKRVRATPFTRIPGKLTRRDYITLKNEAHEGACKIAIKECITTHIPSLLNFSDLLTKVLYGKKRRNLVEGLMINIYQYDLN